jgi:hypothetical protein
MWKNHEQTSKKRSGDDATSSKKQCTLASTQTATTPTQILPNKISNAAPARLAHAVCLTSQTHSRQEQHSTCSQKEANCVTHALDHPTYGLTLSTTFLLFQQHS